MKKILFYLMILVAVLNCSYVYSSAKYEAGKIGYNINFGIGYGAYYSNFHLDNNRAEGPIMNGFVGFEAQFAKYYSLQNTVYFGGISNNSIDMLKKASFQFLYEVSNRIYLGTPYIFTELGLGISIIIRNIDIVSTIVEGDFNTALGFNIPVQEDFAIETKFLYRLYFQNKFQNHMDLQAILGFSLAV